MILNSHCNDYEFTLKRLEIHSEIIMDLHLNDSNNNNIMLEH